MRQPKSKQSTREESEESIGAQTFDNDQTSQTRPQQINESETKTTTTTKPEDIKTEISHPRPKITKEVVFEGNERKRWEWEIIT